LSGYAGSPNKASPMTMVGFPLLLIPVAIYNMIAFLMPGVSLTEQADPLFKVALVSGTAWPVTLRDILLTLGILMLLFEVIKGARPGAKFLTDHLLSLIVFGCAAAEFVMWPRFGNSTYFLLTLLTMVDFLSGIALRARRGTVMAATTVSRRSARNAEVPAAEPEFEPAPTPEPIPEPIREPVPAPIVTPVPAATSVAESVLMDRPGPLVEPHVGAPSAHVPETPVEDVHPVGVPPTEVTPIKISPTEVSSHPAPSVEVLPPEPQPGHDSSAVPSPEPDPKRGTL
jgi:hypothetical protein